MKLKPEQRVDYATARSRTIEYMRGRGLCAPSMVANAIWPDHNMKAQGAGAAASRILKRMEKDGEAAWACISLGIRSSWGWKLIGNPQASAPGGGNPKQAGE